jgi:hypothetical protein
MYARKLEYTGFKYGSSLDDIYASGSKPSCNKNDDDCKKYSFISNFAKLDDIKNSNTSDFSFKDNYSLLNKDNYSNIALVGYFNLPAG